MKDCAVWCKGSWLVEATLTKRGNLSFTFTESDRQATGLQLRHAEALAILVGPDAEVRRRPA
jgi:hypothetical protein